MNKLFIILFSMLLISVGCNREDENSIQNVKELYSYEGKVLLAKLQNDKSIFDLNSEYIINYEQYKLEIKDGVTLSNVVFNKAGYLTYEVFVDSKYSHIVALPVYDVNGKDIVNLKSKEDGASLRTTPWQKIEHECSGDCVQEYIGFCSSCKFLYNAHGLITGCDCNHDYGCCIHTIRTAQNVN